MAKDTKKAETVPEPKLIKPKGLGELVGLKPKFVDGDIVASALDNTPIDQLDLTPIWEDLAKKLGEEFPEDTPELAQRRTAVALFKHLLEKSETLEKSTETWDNPAVIEEVPQTTSEALTHQEVEVQETRRKRPSESVVAEAVGKIALANEMLEAAKERLEATVDEARTENVSWAKIGEALDISSSAAHTKFTEKGRKRNRQAQQRYRNKK